MNTPTPEQIEAVAKAVKESLNIIGVPKHHWDRASAAAIEAYEAARIVAERAAPVPVVPAVPEGWLLSEIIPYWDVWADDELSARQYVATLVEDHVFVPTAFPELKSSSGKGPTWQEALAAAIAKAEAQP